jgi:hypothetical protein
MQHCAAMACATPVSWKATMATTTAKRLRHREAMGETARGGATAMRTPHRLEPHQRAGKLPSAYRRVSRVRSGGRRESSAPTKRSARKEQPQQRRLAGSLHRLPSIA